MGNLPVLLVPCSADEGSGECIGDLIGRMVRALSASSLLGLGCRPGTVDDGDQSRRGADYRYGLP
jgi:hypothetical protein